MQTEEYKYAKKLNTERNQRIILRILRGCTDKFITDRQIAVTMGQDPNSFERVVRLCIRELRREGYPIVSESGKGYKWPANRQEAEKTIAEFRSRARDLNETANTMEQSANELFAWQNELPMREGEKT